MTSSAPTDDWSSRVLAVLQGHLSPMSATIVLRRAKERASIPDYLHVGDLPAVARALGPALSFYLSAPQRESIVEAIMSLAGKPSRPSLEIAIDREDDVSAARLAARKLATEQGASNIFALKVATIVSELARNIASYAGHGTIELAVQAGPPRAIRIVAADSGPGITNVGLILSGKYISKTGLGKGLLGVRSMSSRFAIESNSTGTRVDATVLL